MEHDARSIPVRMMQFSILLLVALLLLCMHPERIDAVNYRPLGNFRSKDFAIIRQGTTWHVYAIYCQYYPSLGSTCQSPYPGLMHLTSTDLKNWTEVGYVIPPGSSGTWDDGQIWAPSVVEHDGTYYMFYAGTDTATGGDQKIGLATSTDLYTWTKYSSNPVLDCGGAGFDSDLGGWILYTPGVNAQCRDPFVYWDDAAGRWVMYYSTVYDYPDGDETYPWIPNPAVVGIATSSDLITWTDAGQIPGTWGYTYTESAHIIKHNDTYYLSMTDGGNSKYDGVHTLNQSLVLFTSDNLFTDWTPSDVNYRVPVPDVVYGNYASEYISNRGYEYYAHIDSATRGIDFRRLTWTSSPFDLSDISYGSVSGTIWDDTDADGVQDGTESGIADVDVTLYLSAEDTSQFDPSTALIYATTTTSAAGTYSFGDVLPDTYFISIDPSNAASGATLSGKVATSRNYAQEVTVVGGQTSSGNNVGTSAQDNTWTFQTGTDYTASANIAMSNGRVSSSVSTGTTETIEPISSIEFALLTDFWASSVDNDGSVTFVLSNDGGSTWNYWNGSQWASSDGSAAQSNTAAEIATYAASFPDGGRLLKWRALLYAPSGSDPLLLNVGLASNRAPAMPTLVSPSNGTIYGNGQPQFQVVSSDTETNPVVYQLQVDTSPEFNSAALQTFSQSTVQLGWSGQDASLGTIRYGNNDTATYTALTKLAFGTWYWRARTSDPEGSGKYSAYTASRTFVVPPSLTAGSFVAEPVGTSSLKVTWTSSSAAIGSVDYGTTALYGSITQESSATTSHAVLLTGLTPNITYHIRTKIADDYGQTVLSGDYSVVIPCTVISAVSATTTSTTATVRWTTNEPSSTTVEYGTTASYAKTKTAVGYGTVHSVVITGLSPLTTYHYRVQSVGSTTAVTADGTLKTDHTPVTKPTLLSVATARGVVKVVGKGPAGHTIRLYIDGKYKKSLKLPGRTGMKTFTTMVGISKLVSGRHSLTAIAVNSRGWASQASQAKRFSVSAR